MVPGETVVVEKEVIKEVEVVKEIVVQVPEGPEEGVINLRMSSMVLKFAPYTAVSGAVSAVGNYVFSHMVFADPHNYEYIRTCRRGGRSARAAIPTPSS